MYNNVERQRFNTHHADRQQQTSFPVNITIFITRVVTEVIKIHSPIWILTDKSVQMQI